MKSNEDPKSESIYYSCVDTDGSDGSWVSSQGIQTYPKRGFNDLALSYIIRFTSLCKIFTYLSQTGIYFKTWYAEYIKSITQPRITTNFTEYAFNTHHIYTNIETNQEILHILPKGPKLNTTKQYEIYRHYKQSPPTY